MKKRMRILSLLLLLSMFTACGEADVAMLNDTLRNSAVLMPQEPVVYEAPVYGFESTECTGSYVREDTGETAASYRYTLPQMYVENEETLSAEDRELAVRNAEAFNARMAELMEEFTAYGEEVLDEQKFLVETGENVPFVAVDEIVGRTVQAGEIVSILAQCYNYCGGAHPNSYTLSYTFDLSIGQFIDPAQIADDPESFRIGAAQLLIEQADSLGEDYTEGFWADYRDSIARWNEAAVMFSEEGMTVIFSVYTLGPYAMGPVELTLDYTTLREALGAGGLAHLGVETDDNT